MGLHAEMKSLQRCGKCVYLEDINKKGRGWCAQYDMYFWRHLDDRPCEYYEELNHNN